MLVKSGDYGGGIASGELHKLGELETNRNQAGECICRYLTQLFLFFLVLLDVPAGKGKERKVTRVRRAGGIRDNEDPSLDYIYSGVKTTSAFLSARLCSL